MDSSKLKWIIIVVLIIGSGIYLFKMMEWGEPPGCFKFYDGTTQNWTLDQLYDTKSDPPKKITTFVPGTPPTYKTYTPFSLANHQNIALEANTGLYLVSNKKVKSADIYFESPDLSKDTNWQNIVGYSIDVRREFYSPCGDPPKKFFAQLQLKMIDTSDNSAHLLAETDTAGDWKFHELKLNTPYSLEWKWGKKLEVGGKFLTSSDYKVEHVRVRFIMPGWIGEGECFYRGKWKIGNVCRVK